MDQLLVYMPTDRRYALARGETLPDRVNGAALFADISGFTPLTEGLARMLGPRQGAEELTRQLNQVYDALIAEVDNYRGSVIGFAGDAITCWFDDGDGPASLRAVQCAFRIQAAMKQFAEVPLPDGTTTALAMKASVATGPARRFFIGLPELQQIDAIAGSTVARMAAGEHHAEKGEVVVDETTVKQLGAVITIKEWRIDEETGDRFAALDRLLSPIEPDPWPLLAADAISLDQKKIWLLPEVFKRMDAGLGEFLMELRPAVAIFVRFDGIDYDHDEDAEKKLDAYTRWVQTSFARYEGNLLQLTIGDKGSYLYGAFGAPLAHEDDVRRAVSVALELRTTPPEFNYIKPVQIGISRGTMRTGGSGSSTRRTYGVLGDEVNLAARLMQHASPGEVLVSGYIHKVVPYAFAWQTLEPISVKGKSEPVPIFRAIGKQLVTTEAALFTRGLVGRKQELAQLARFVRPILDHRFAGLLFVYGEPGVGKSRLVYELRQQLNHLGRHIAWHTALSEGILRQSLHPFRYFLLRYFDQSPEQSEEENKAKFSDRLDRLISGLQAVEGVDRSEVKALAEELDRTRSILGAQVDLYWSGSLHDQLQPKQRFENTLTAFKTLIAAESLLQPVILHIEDAQFLDADSRQLIETLTRNAAQYPCALLLTSRYQDDGSRISLELEAEIPQPVIDLNQLSSEDVQALTAQMLGGPISEPLTAFLAEKTQGNPFFLEQFTSELRDRNLLLQVNGQWAMSSTGLSEVPTSINALLVARLDRLTAQVKAVVQTASVLGQEFEVRVLSEMLRNDQYVPDQIKQAETESIWLPLSEIRYIFKHALLHDAAYDMQLLERLRRLHHLAGLTIEAIAKRGDDLPQYSADLAYHFNQAQDLPRELRYARLAGDSAAARFANTQAVTYYSRALDILPAAELAARYDLLLAREKVYDAQGDRTAQVKDIEELETLADRLTDLAKQGEVALRRANYEDVTSDFPAVLEAVRHAVSIGREANLIEIEAAGHFRWGRALWQQADYPGAQAQLQSALRLAVQAHLPQIQADCQRILGTVANNQGDYAQAQQHFDEALRLYREVGDRWGQGGALLNLGNSYSYRGDYMEARQFGERALQAFREIGSRWGESVILGNLGTFAMDQGDYVGARTYYEQGLRLCREIGNRRDECISLGNLADVALYLGDHQSARNYTEQAIKLARQIGNKLSESWSLASQSLLLHQNLDDEAAYEYSQRALAIAADVGARHEQARAYTFSGHASIGLGQLSEAVESYERALALRRELGQQNLEMEALAGLARVLLAQNKIDEARTHVETILLYLTTGNLNGTDEPIRVYLTCYYALKAAGDPRAEKTLITAYNFLQERAERIQDDALRQSFMEKVPAHRELIAELKTLER
jgi:class 3 adenylate cyclase/tetratricopeptide (TPR) repeat protein